MTFKEKLSQDRPDLIRAAEIYACPCTLGYEKELYCKTAPLDCKKCWNRIIPKNFEAETCELCSSEFPIWYLIGCSPKFSPKFCPQCGRKLEEDRD